MLTFFKKYKQPILYTVLGLYILAMCVLAILPSIPDLQLSTYQPSDKVLHFAQFFVFGILMYAVLILTKTSHPVQITTTAILVLTIITETAQLFVTSRTFSTSDMIADLAGGFLGLFILILFHKIIEAYSKWITYKQSS